jgi:serine protease
VAGGAALYLADNPGATPSQVMTALENSASSNKISGVNGSPNLLLYTLFDGGGDDGGGDDGGGDDGGGSDGVLENGTPVTDLSGASGDELRFTMDVPSGASDLSFQMSGGSGDADLYVQFGSEPTTSSYDCRPYNYGNDETCDFASPSAGTWHVMVRGYDSFSGVDLVGSYTADDGGGDDGGDSPSGCPSGYEEYTGSLSGGRGTSAYEPDGSYYYSGSGTHDGILISPDDAIFDLYLQKWQGGSWSDVASDLPSSGTDAAEVSYSGGSGYYVWRAEIWNGSGDYTFCMDTP